MQIGHSLDQQLIQLPEPLPAGRRDRVVRVAHGWTLAWACGSLMFMPMAAAMPIPAQLLQRQCLDLEHILILPVSKALAAVALLAGAWVGPAAAAPLACKGPAHIHTGDAATIARQMKATGKKVLTFVGYSRAGY